MSHLAKETFVKYCRKIYKYIKGTQCKSFKGLLEVKLLKLLEKYPKLCKFSLTLNFFKNYFKTTKKKKKCKEGRTDFCNLKT